MTIRKGDPRVALLVSQQQMSDETPDVLAVLGQPADGDGHTIELLVSLHTDAVPAQLQRETWKWRHMTGRIYSVQLPPAEVADVESSPSVRAYEPPRPIMPMTREALRSTGISEVHHLSRRGNHVVVGIIDFGFDFTLQDFIDDDTGETRVAFLWDQTLPPSPTEHAPDGYDYGVEYSSNEINAALQDKDPFQKVRHKPQPNSHGTHVAGIAAGNGRGAKYQGHSYSGAAPEATIIFVQPRVDSSGQMVTVTNSARLVDAVTYIFDRAKVLRMPCVINLSLGHYATGHDGETALERAIDYLLQDRGRAVVVAAGNAGTLNTHREWHFTGGDSLDIQWRIPQKSGDCHHEIEMWYSSRAEVTVQLRSPGGQTSETIQANDDRPQQNLGGNAAFITSTRFNPMNGDSRTYIWLHRGSATKLLAPGDWTIHLEVKSPEAGVLHAWIERVIGPPEAQSFFPDSASAAVTLGSPATSRYCLAVGNWNGQDEKPDATSSAGPTRDGRKKPEIVAPGTDIVSCHSLAGREGPKGLWPSTTVKSGTSMSAPLVAGLIACLFEENRQLTAPQVSKILAASCSSTGYKTDTGYGLVDGVQALKLVRNFMA